MDMLLCLSKCIIVFIDFFCSLFVILDQSHMVCKRPLYCLLCTGSFLILSLWNSNVSACEARSKWVIPFLAD